MAMKQRLNILTLVCLFAAILFSCKQQSPANFIDEQYTLGPEDKRPFGGFVAKSIIDSVFHYSAIESNRKTFSSWYNSENELGQIASGDAYVIMSPAVRAYEREAADMVRYVKDGNTLVFMTDEISDELAEAFGFRIIDETENIAYTIRFEMLDTKLKLIDSANFSSQAFSYYYYPFLSKISASNRHDSVHTIALNASDKPAVMRMAIGSGQLIIATNARAFGNYFLLTANNYQYLQQLLSYFPSDPSHLTWDAFYQRNTARPPEDYSVFDALLSIPPLRWSFWILMALALIWVLSNLRRKQKMIPVLQPNTNTTVSFIQTIAQLYFNKQDHANIGRKMTAHFLDYLRNNFYMPPNMASAEWAAVLSQKTGLASEEANEAVRLMRKAQNAEDFSDADLLRLHGYISQVKSVEKK